MSCLRAVLCLRLLAVVWPLIWPAAWALVPALAWV